MTYLLDSDIVIDYFKKREPSFDFISHILHKDRVVISTITLTEVRAGWDDSQAATLRPLLSDLFEITEVTVAIADRAGEQIKKYAQAGKQLSTTITSPILGWRETGSCSTVGCGSNTTNGKLQKPWWLFYHSCAACIPPSR